MLTPVERVCLLLVLFICVLFFRCPPALGVTAAGSTFRFIGSGGGAGGLGAGGGGGAGGSGGGAGIGGGGAGADPPPKHIVLFL